MNAQLEQPPPPLRNFVDNVPPKVEAAVMRALEKDPSARFQSVSAFARAIDACLAQVAPTPAGPGDRGLDAPTTSRTAINPMLQGVKQLPAGPGAQRAAVPGRPAIPRWAALTALSLAVLALGAGAALLWSYRSPSEPASNAKATSPSLTQAPISQPAPAPAPPEAQPTVVAAEPAAAPQPAAAGSSVALALPAPAPSPAPIALPPSPPPAVAPPKSRTLAIVRLGADGSKSAAAAGSADAVQTFRAGEHIRLLIKPSDDSHVYCYLQDETQRILRFYPNRFRKSALVKAGAALELPGKMRFELVANSLKLPETIACFASARDVMAELPSAVTGADFAPLPVASLEELKNAFERLGGEAPAQASLRVLVQ